MSETTHTRKVLHWLSGIGAYAIKIHGHEMQESGIHDILGCFEGKFFSIEMKMPGNKASKLQEYHAERIELSGGLATVAHNLEEVQSWFLAEGFISEAEI